MIKPLIAVCAAFSTWSAPAQTNGFHPEWFIAPQLMLRPVQSDRLPEANTPWDDFKLEAQLRTGSGKSALLQNETIFLARNVNMDQSLADFDLQVYYRLEKEGYFTLPSRSESRWERAMENTFSAEEVHFRKVTVSCSILTAIKRRNPLCLLNPCVLQITW